ncbi:2-C-methyl-D-erythritol 4-phosphate cytidylyltransferase [Leucobacter soli]|uniref:2-C-methyl-D-erythritol 4-phosphate cytidylyltransferase n=1 Tax=Leucobacter soli TaxID=2812850 RepID=A0A916JUS5_9MICO|nr:2-C-methyl-D-erythritol 4-phosphate cytidylyltransferase [Leucobacter soli]CAG7604123.1 2-C-methyl-D-erythritol 4-phosphate cytidylyltransferase [Leucobacter soli]
MNTPVSPHHLAALGVVIVAAGRGERLGADRPKAFVELGGRTLLEHAVGTVVSLDRPGQLVLVVPEGRAAEALEIADAALPAERSWQISVVNGGRERHESVRNGLDALRDGIETVLVHDAARPLTPAEVFERVAEEVQRTGDGIIPAMPVVDTLKRVDIAGRVRSTADRRILAAVQTPQGFPFEVLAAAHESAQAREEAVAPSNDAPTDDAEVVQRFGGTVRTVPGDARAHKVTTPVDLLMLQGLLLADEAEARTPAPDAHAVPAPSVATDRDGFEADAAPVDDESAEAESAEAEGANAGSADTDSPSADSSGSVDVESAVPGIDSDGAEADGTDTDGTDADSAAAAAPEADDPTRPVAILLPPAPEYVPPMPLDGPADSATAEALEHDEPEEELDEFERLLRGLD